AAEQGLAAGDRSRNVDAVARVEFGQCAFLGRGDAAFAADEAANRAIAGGFGSQRAIRLGGAAYSTSGAPEKTPCARRCLDVVVSPWSVHVTAHRRSLQSVHCHDTTTTRCPQAN